MTMAKAGVVENGIAAQAQEAQLEQVAFQRFPYGMIVLDGDGRIVACNAQARRLIEATGRDGASELSCCALFGCRTAETVLGEVCLTELALERGEALPEIRVDVTTSDGAVNAMWVVVAPLEQGPDGSRNCVLQMRPGPARDRRRRTDPHWMRGPSLRVRTLGRIVVESTEGVLDGNWLDQRTGQLLKYLLTERNRFVPADEIGESLWQNADAAIASSVRYCIHALRRKIEPRRGNREPSAFIVSRSGSYRLNLELVKVDADEFEAHVSAGLDCAERDPHAATSRLEQGLALYRGDFLADVPYAEWAMAERHRLHDLACAALQRLTELHLDRGDEVNAVRALERLGKLAPYDEEVHRRLMELDVAAGRRSDALRRYSALKARTRRTFGQDLGFTPADLAASRR